MQKLSFKKVLIILIKIGLSILAFYIIYQKVAFEKVGFYIKQANWIFLFLAFLAFFVSKAIAALRINCYYRTQQLILPEILNLKLTLLAIFYNLFIPMVGGEGYRVYWLNQRSNTGIKPLISASFLDRISGLLVLLCLAILFFPFTGIALPFKTLVIMAIPVIYGVYFVVHRWLFQSFQPAWWKVTGYSILVQSLQITCTFFILLALNVNHQIVDYLFIFLLSSMAFVLPFMGAREMAFVFGASFLGLDADLSLTVSLFFFLSMAITSMSGLFFFFFPSFLILEKVEEIPA
jgi:uncharacterized membrane protein YbhN (UPF0104 family)